MSSHEYTMVSKLNQLPNLLNTLLFSVKTVLRAGPLIVLLFFLLSSLSGLIPLVALYANKLVIDAIVGIVQNPDKEITTAFTVALTFQLGIIIFQIAIKHLNAYVNYIMGTRVAIDLQLRIKEKTSLLDFQCFEDSKFYDMLRRVNQGASGRPLALVKNLSLIGQNVLSIVFISGIITVVSFRLFGLMLLLCLPLLFFQVYFGHKGYNIEYQRTEAKRQAGYFGSILNHRDAIPELRSYSLFEHFKQKWLVNTIKFMKQDIRLRTKHDIVFASLGILLALSQIFVLYFLVRQVVNGQIEMSVGGIMMYSSAYGRGLSAFRALTQGVSSIYNNSIYINDIIEFEALKPSIEVSRDGYTMPKAIESIELQNVSFSYPGSAKKVLHDASIVIKGPRCVHLIGNNGAGKSTLIKLLIRLYDPDNGRILINGIDVRKYRVDSLRQNIGVFFQKTLRYALTAKETIALGNIHILDDMRQIIQSAQRANVDTLIDKLPSQYETMLSKLFDNGQDLSYGQWQGISLARLFAKEASFYIFDEPTAYLDKDRERFIFREITSIAKSSILLLISHKSPNVFRADQVIALKDGKFHEIEAM